MRIRMKWNCKRGSWKYSAWVTTYPSSKGGCYWVMDDREPTYYQYCILDMDIHGCAFCHCCHLEPRYSNRQISSTSCFRSRYRKPHLYICKKSSRRWEDCEKLPLAPWRSYGGYIPRKSYGSCIWLAYSRFKRWMDRSLSPSDLLWPFHNPRIFIDGNSHSSTYSILSQVTSEPSFSLPLEFSWWHNCRKICWSFCWLASLCLRIYPYRIALDASFLEYICRCYSYRSGCLCRRTNTIIPYLSISYPGSSILVLWASRSFPSGIYLHDSFLTVYQRITPRKTPSLKLDIRLEDFSKEVFSLIFRKCSRRHSLNKSNRILPLRNTSKASSTRTYY